MPRISDVIVSSQRAASTDLSVARRGALRGTAIDLSNDALLEGLELRLWDAQGAQAGSLHTAQDGSFEFTNLKPGAYRVEVLLPRGYGLSQEPGPVSVQAGQETQIDLELVLIGRVEGRVVDEDTGEPVPGARVRLFDSSERLIGETETDAAGVYAFTGLPEDKYRVET